MNTADHPTPANVDRFGAGDYPADLYITDKIAPSVGCLADIGVAELEFFAVHGYLRVLQAFDEDQVQAAIAGLHSVIDQGSDEVDVQFEQRVGDRIDDLGRQERRDAVRRLMRFTTVEARLRALAGHARLQHVLRQVLGNASLTLFQDMALLKPPGGGREKPWHQDLAFFELKLGTPVVGVWISLDTATRENGCMHVVPGSHREGPRKHVWRRDFQICDIDVPRSRITAAPLPRGGCLLFDGLLMHGTPANTTPDQLRRAVQLHFAPSDAVRVTREDRMAVFGADPTEARC